MSMRILARIKDEGIQSIPYQPVLRVAPWLLGLAILKLYFNGARNMQDRIMHSKVAIVTGGTSGIGAAIVDDLASRGTQLILLVKDPSDAFTVDYIEDLRTRHSNELIYAEKCDLSELHQVRLFATKYIDNSPPRRLDMVICCAGLMAPPGLPRATTYDGVEAHWGINYLAHFHLLNLLAPVIRIQPPDRDVRILLATCTSHVLGELDFSDTQFLKRRYPARQPWKVYGASKLALMSFGIEYQKRLWAYERKDKEVMNVRVYNVDPGMTRTPGMRRWLSFGSLWGLFLYLVMWPFWWLVLKHPMSAAQTFLMAIMSPDYGGGEGGQMLRECSTVKYRNEGLTDPALAKKLWDLTETTIADVEKKSAVQRKKAEKEAEKERKKNPNSESEEQRKERERLEAVKRKNAETVAKRRIIDQLIKEEEAKLGAQLDLPQIAVPAGMFKDVPPEEEKKGA